MKALIVGCGSIGERHLKNLLTLGGIEIVICDVDENRLIHICNKYPVKGYATLKDALKNHPNLTLVCTPTREHLPVALSAAKTGSHLFIEKPISDRICDDLKKLEDLLAKQNLHCLVGCNMRFHPAVVQIYEFLHNGSIGNPYSLRAHFGHYLPNWRAGQDYKLSYSANRDLGGGIILDAIHELDYVRWLFGDIQEVFCYSQITSELDIEVEDCADILLSFVNGRVASIHLDYLDQVKRRSCDIVGSKGTIIWHSTGKDPENAKVEFHRDNYTYHSDRYVVDINEPYLKEIQHLLECIEGSDNPLLDVRGATFAIEVALAAMESASTGLPVKIKSAQTS